jgi:hypothetical protein
MDLQLATNLVGMVYLATMSVLFLEGRFVLGTVLELFLVGKCSLVLVFGMDFLLVISYWGMVNKEPMSVPFLVDMFGPSRPNSNHFTTGYTRTRLYLSSRKSSNSISRSNICTRKSSNVTSISNI